MQQIQFVVRWRLNKIWKSDSQTGSVHKNRFAALPERQFILLQRPHVGRQVAATLALYRSANHLLPERPPLQQAVLPALCRLCGRIVAGVAPQAPKGARNAALKPDHSPATAGNTLRKRNANGRQTSNSGRGSSREREGE